MPTTPLFHCGLKTMVAFSCARHFPWETMSRASWVISRSIFLRSLLLSLICSPMRKAVWSSEAVSSSTARRPLSIRPAALMRGPILNTMSSMPTWPGSSLERLIMASRPLRGSSLSRRRPKWASTRFSPTMVTRSDEMLTTSRSSSGSSDSNGMSYRWE